MQVLCDFLVTVILLAMGLYILFDSETWRTLFLAKRAKRVFHKYGNNRLEAIVFDVEKNLENK